MERMGNDRCAGQHLSNFVEGSSNFSAMFEFHHYGPLVHTLYI